MRSVSPNLFSLQNFYRTAIIFNLRYVMAQNSDEVRKRDKKTWRFMDVKQDGTLFKGVRKEK